MLTSEFMLTNMNEFLAFKVEHLLPIVSGGEANTTLITIAIVLIIPALIPEICWLVAFLTPFALGLAVTLPPLIVGLTVIMTPLLILFSPLIIVFLMFFGVALSVGGATVSAVAIPLVLAPYFFIYGFLMFNAIFGEIILIPWFLLTIIP